MAATITMNTISVEVKTSSSLLYLMERYHVKEALSALWPTLVYVEFASEGGPNSWLTIPVHRGEKVVFWRPPVPTVDTTALIYSANDPAPLGVSATVVSGTCLEYVNGTILTDWSIDTPVKSSVDVAMENMTEKAARSFNALIYAAISGTGTARFSKLSADGGKVSANTLTAACILDKRQLEELAFYLHANKIRPYRDGYYKYAVAPACVKDLRGEATQIVGWSDWINRHMQGDETRGWEIGSICGFKMIETTEITAILSASMSAGSSGDHAYYNAWAGYESIGAVSLAGKNLPGPPKGAKTPKLKSMQTWKPQDANIRLIVKPPGSAGVHDPWNRRGHVGYKFCTLIKVLDSIRCGYHLCGSKGSATGTYA